MKFDKILHVNVCECGNIKSRWHDEICKKCKDKRVQTKRETDLSLIASQDIEIRLRNIEAYIYDQQNKHKW